MLELSIMMLRIRLFGLFLPVVFHSVGVLSFIMKSDTKATQLISFKHKADAPLFAEDKRKTGLDESVRTRLLSESIAPWRSLRLFLYGSFASGALLGGLITLSGAAAVISGAKEGDMNTEVGFVYFPYLMHYLPTCSY